MAASQRSAAQSHVTALTFSRSDVDRLRDRERLCACWVVTGPAHDAFLHGTPLAGGRHNSSQPVGCCTEWLLLEALSRARAAMRQLLSGATVYDITTNGVSA